MLSIASICDAGGTATFTAKEVTVHFDGKIALQGPIDFTGLWTVLLSASKHINPVQTVPNDSQNKEPEYDAATMDCAHMPTLFPQNQNYPR